MWWNSQWTILKWTILVSFSAFIIENLLHLVPKQLHLPKSNPRPVKQFLPILPSLQSWTTNILCSLSVDLSVLCFSYKWNHTIFILFCLASFLYLFIIYSGFLFSSLISKVELSKKILHVTSSKAYPLRLLLCIPSTEKFFGSPTYIYPWCLPHGFAWGVNVYLWGGQSTLKGDVVLLVPILGTLAT